MPGCWACGNEEVVGKIDILGIFVCYETEKVRRLERFASATLVFVEVCDVCLYFVVSHTEYAFLDG